MEKSSMHAKVMRNKLVNSFKTNFYSTFRRLWWPDSIQDSIRKRRRVLHRGSNIIWSCLCVGSSRGLYTSFRVSRLDWTYRMARKSWDLKFIKINFSEKNSLIFAFSMIFTLYLKIPFFWIVSFCWNGEIFLTFSNFIYENFKNYIQMNLNR